MPHAQAVAKQRIHQMPGRMARSVIFAAPADKVELPRGLGRAAASNYQTINTDAAAANGAVEFIAAAEVAERQAEGKTGSPGPAFGRETASLYVTSRRRGGERPMGERRNSWKENGS